MKCRPSRERKRKINRAGSLARLFSFLLLPAASASAVTAGFDTQFDKWMYENVSGTVGGQNDAAPINSVADTNGSVRFQGFLVAFNTASLAGLVNGNFQLTSITLTLVNVDGSFVYDPTPDSYRTELPVGDPNRLADDDGKPLELFGVGLRNGYTGLNATVKNPSNGTYGEYSPYGTTGQTNFQNAYPLGKTAPGVLKDVSTNVLSGEEATAFAIGKTTGLTPNIGLAGSETKFTFTLDLTDPDILAYVRNSISSGVLGFYVSTYNLAQSQTGPHTYPRFYTWEGAAGALVPEYTPHLEIQYAIVPEPRISGLLIAGLGLFAAGRGVRNRHRLS